MQCPECSSTDISKNGKQRDKQNYLCKTCQRQFIETHDPPFGYSDEFKRECLKMYVNGMGFRGIERVKGVHHTTVINACICINDSINQLRFLRCSTQPTSSAITTQSEALSRE